MPSAYAKVASRLLRSHSEEDREGTILVTLDQLYQNKRAKVIDIQGGQGIRQRLSQMGIHPGDVITILRYGALGGPILIEVHGSQVALGRGIAARITVEEMDENCTGRPA